MHRRGGGGQGRGNEGPGNLLEGGKRRDVGLAGGGFKYNNCKSYAGRDNSYDDLG